MDGERPPVGLSRAVFLGPLSIICLACVALAVLKSELTDQGELCFVALAPAVVLQAALLVPLGLHWLRPSAAPLSRRLSTVAIGLVTLSLLALVKAWPW